MHGLWIFLSVLTVIAVVGAFAIERIKRMSQADDVPSPDNFDRLNGNYRRRFDFLTPSEKAYFKQLHAHCAALGQFVFVKVRLEDLIYIPQRITWSDRSAMRGFVKSRHIDFVVTDSECNVQYCVELDDPSHLRTDRQERDRKVERILEMAGIRLIRENSWTGKVQQAMDR